jgi:ubiquinone/menaquinone biosynthesis C-methylase UbiE
MPEKSSWKEHYWYTVPVMKARIEKIIELTQPEGKKILEVGCNEGFVSKALMENGGLVTPVDYDPAMCKKANDIFGLDVVQGNIMELPFEDQSFDVALGCEVLEHISNPFKGLSELFRVAREKVVITVPVGEYWAGEVTHQWMLFGGFINHNNVEIYSAEKDILILCFKRIRNDQFKDIPPFNTAELKKRFSIG